ncbi:MAG: DUF3626 domain-containing protein [Bdellovibrionaceae bacterium]|nr:DUF3626 domain-containing protein [Pseudobdellovibrionaceae bacterium]
MKISVLKVNMFNLTVHCLDSCSPICRRMLPVLISTLGSFFVVPNASAATLCKTVFEDSSYTSSNIVTVKSMVEKLNLDLDQILKSEGFESFGDLVKALQRSQEPEIQANLQMLRSDAVLMSINQPSRDRLEIMQSGFLNFHQTKKTSEGNLNVTSSRRSAVEASYLNIKFDQFNHLNNELKPKYGAMHFTGELPSGETTQYGGDFYFFKKNVASEVTFTIGDSFNGRVAMHNPSWENGKDIPASRWDQIFIPWSRRAIIALFMSRKSYDGSLFLDRESVDPNIHLQRSHMRREYIELQFLGKKNLDQVEAFAFTEQPPSGAFLKALRDRNIIIYDRRSGKNVVWDEKPL